ncbi:hypothetical protein QTV49_000303 [Vibrio vulnificus]|nr:hypothetical protein [Vibrio vulnificus]
MSFPTKKLATTITASVVLSSSVALAETVSPISTTDPLTCTDEEIMAVMVEYEASLGSIDKYHVPRFEEFREVRMAYNAQDPETKDKNLCDVLADPSFEIPSIDYTMLQSGWTSLKALMAGNSGGVDWSTVMSEAYQAGMEKAKKWWLESSCKLGKNFSQAANESIDEAYKDTQDFAKDTIENTEQAKDLGVSDLDKPLYQQIAEKKTEEQLGEYAGYAKWYDDDEWGEEGRQDSMDDLVDKIIGDGVDKTLDSNLDGKGSDRLDSILDKIEPKY